VEEMPVVEKNSGRESKRYLEVKVPEGSTGVSG
jgi:hypothetical protein